MSDQQLGMKIFEEWGLDLFLEACEAGTWQRLLLRDSGERPDFVWARQNGRLVGIELTQVRRDPESGSDDGGPPNGWKTVIVSDTFEMLLTEGRFRAKPELRLSSDVLLC